MPKDPTMTIPMLRLLTVAVALVAHPVLSQDIKPKAAGDAAPMMVMDRGTFVEMVSSSNAFEIRSSEMAKQNTENGDIKKMGEMIIKDHKAAGEKLKATLEAKKAPLAEPAKLAPKHQKMLDQLQAAKEKDFDMLYLDMQAQAHMEAVGLFRTYAGSGDDMSVVGFAKETLPSLETHLAHVKMMIAAQ
jgi:putative membrane protein